MSVQVVLSWLYIFFSSNKILRIRHNLH